MKNSKKTYVLLSAILCVCIIGMVILGYSLFFANNSLTMANFENSSKTDVLKWVTKNKLENNIKYVYEYSDSIEEGNVISQSIKKDEKVEGDFTITISKGNIIKLSVSDYNTKEDFDKFISSYPNVKVTYDNDNSTASIIESFSKDSIDIKKDELIVKLKSNDSSENTNKDNKDENNEKDSNTATIPTNLLGTEESKFIKTLNDLGFKNLKKSETKYYSFTSKKDTIYSYDDGKLDLNKTINYAISLGDYPSSFDAKEYNNLTLNDANKVVKKYNDLNAHITLKTNNVETADSKLIGKLANCKCVKDGTKSIITCDIYIAKSETVQVTSFAGKTESEMKDALKKLGFTKFNNSGSKYSTSYAKNTILTNDTGNFTKNTTINYTLSLGSYINDYHSNEYNGHTLAEVQSLVASYNNKGANIVLDYKEKEFTDNSYVDGTLGECTPASSNVVRITCSLWKKVQMYNITGEQIIMTQCQGNSYEDAVNKVKDFFGGKFTNLNFVPVERAEGVGTIVDVIVDGNTEYTAGSYRYDTKIDIYIVNKQRQ